jgi:type I restriction enzyme R subunit
MNDQTKEKAFETYIEDVLLNRSGWKRGTVDEWDKQNALFPQRIFEFLETTQPKLWESMQKLHGAGLEAMLIQALVKELEVKGTLHVLRQGFKFYGKTFRLAYFKPAHGLAPDVIERYEKNDLTVTRQIPCHPNDTKTIDMVLAINGLPVATIELKNPQTGQNWSHAIKQYRQDRNPAAPLFGFKTRSLVHFAVDSEQVYMTTRLRKDKTFFPAIQSRKRSGAGQMRGGKSRASVRASNGLFLGRCIATR